MGIQTQLKWLFFPLLILAMLPSAIGITGLSLFLSGIIITWYTAKWGVGYTLSAIPLLFLGGVLFDGKELGFLLGIHAVSAFVIGAFIYRRGRFSGLLISATLTETAVLTGYTLWICHVLNTTPADVLFGSTIHRFSEIIISSGSLDGQTLAEMQKMLYMMSDMLRRMLPFFYLSGALLYVYVLFAIGRFLLKKQDVCIDTMPRFYEFWLPKSISTIFVILFLITLFTDMPILSNVVSFMFMIHVICGLSVVDYFMRGKEIPSACRILIIAVLLALSVLVGGLISSILCCMGMTDNVRGVRK